MENALLTICWIFVVVLAFAIKDRFIDRPRMERLERRIDVYARAMNWKFVRLFKSVSLGVTNGVRVADSINTNMEEMARLLGLIPNGKHNGKNGAT